MNRTVLATACVFLLTACSGGGDTADVSIPTVPSANTAPIVASANTDQSAQFGYDFSYDATKAGAAFTDADGNTLSYAVSYAPTAAGLSDNAGVVTGIVSANTDITVTITASDGNGGSISDSFVIVVTIDQSAINSVFAGSIDLENLSDYEGQVAPNYIGKLNEGDNSITNAGATLGRVLFYDTSLSVTGMVSCASCHLQARGFSDPDVVSSGVLGGVTGRHSMRLINTQFADEDGFFWDERAASHEAQETEPIKDHNELGFSGLNGRLALSDLMTTMEGTEYYEELFRFAFLDPEITEEKLQLALAQFTKSIQSFDSPFDVGRAAAGNDNANFANFTADENAGKTLFMSGPNNGGAGCAACHRPPEFDIDPDSGHNGVVGVANSAAFDFTNTRSPSLRDLLDLNGVSNGPFMHDGSLASLDDVLDHYNAIQDPTGGSAAFINRLDRRLRRGGALQSLGLTQSERDQIVAFLAALSGTSIYTDVKLSDPFP